MHQRVRASLVWKKPAFTVPSSRSPEYTGTTYCPSPAWQTPKKGFLVRSSLSCILRIMDRQTWKRSGSLFMYKQNGFV